MADDAMSLSGSEADEEPLAFDSDAGSAEESEGEDIVSETVDDDPHGEFGMYFLCEHLVLIAIQEMSTMNRRAKMKKAVKMKMKMIVTMNELGHY